MGVFEVPSHGRAASAPVRGFALWAMSLALASGLCAAQESGISQRRREVICTGYAEQAAAQIEENRERGCGFLGPRWSPDSRAHYEWCLAAPLEEVRREAEARARALERCGGPDDPAPRCREYADEAAAQELENQRRRCGFSGPRWSLDADGHYAWCMVTGGAATRQESEARRRMLESECAAEPPVDRAFCERYAERSVELQAENLRRRCGFDGDDWTTSLEVHLERCLSLSPEDARAALQIRRQALDEGCVVEPEMVRVPPVVGFLLEPGLRRIEGAGLRAERLDEPSERSPGTILRQEPEAGRLVPVGASVTIWVGLASRVEPPDPTGPAVPPDPTEPAEPPGSGEPSGPPRRPEWPERPKPPPPVPPSIPWLWILGGLVLVGVVYLLAKGALEDRGERRRPGEPPELLAVPDLGSQRLEAEQLVAPEIELRPVGDPGSQDLETDGGLVSKERRID